MLAAPVHPAQSATNALLGIAQIQTNRPEQGIAECEQALALDQNLADAHASIGAAKIDIGRATGTEAHIREALRLPPRDMQAYWWMMILGNAKSFLGADAEAVASLRRSIDANRNLPFAHFNLAAVLAQLGRLDEARAAAQAGLALDPSFTLHRFPPQRKEC